MLTTSIDRWKRDQSLADLRTARICSILVSSKDDPHAPDEFMVNYDSKEPKEKRKQTPEEMAAILRGITLQHGGKIIDD